MAANEIPSILYKYGNEKVFLKGSNIYKINNSITHCYFILSGTVKIYIDHKNGRRSILDFAGSNDWLGEISLFYDEPNIKENKVLQEVKCLEFDLLELQKLCKENSKASFYFASYLSEKLLVRSYRMSENLNYSLDNRLAFFILKHQHNGIYRIPHVDVSEYMNVSYRHVLFVIKQFCELGILAKEEGKGYLITDIDKLKQYQRQ